MGIKGEGPEKTSVLILGIDGYIGWPLANHLARLGYSVTGVDNFSRRDRVKGVGSDSLTPISSIECRQKKFDIANKIVGSLEELPKVDAIVHLAEQPAAPWSMKNYNQAALTQMENVLGTLKVLWLMRKCCPDAHLIKLGTMGEYGTPDCIIPEGFIEDGPMKGLPFPRVAGSFYHLSKVFDSQNVEFACKVWGLRSTDIMQGPVFGILDDTRFDYDECFGTVINRFCTEAVAGIPLTVYGRGGQTRGYLPLEDSIKCITLLLENPPQSGQYRIVNQFAKIRSINELAILVSHEARGLGLEWAIHSHPNPRVEKEHHEYMPRADKLQELGYKPSWQLSEKINELLRNIVPFKDRINKEVIYPATKWR